MFVRFGGSVPNQGGHFGCPMFIIFVGEILLHLRLTNFFPLHPVELIHSSLRSLAQIHR